MASRGSRRAAPALVPSRRPHSCAPAARPPDTCPTRHLYTRPGSLSAGQQQVCAGAGAWGPGPGLQPASAGAAAGGGGGAAGGGAQRGAGQQPLQVERAGPVGWAYSWRGPWSSRCSSAGAGSQAGSCSAGASPGLDVRGPCSATPPVCRSRLPACRIRHGGSEVVLYRDNLQQRMRGLAILPPPPGDEAPLFEHVCATVLQQSHLCPVPLEFQARRGAMAL